MKIIIIILAIVAAIVLLWIVLTISLPNEKDNGMKWNISLIDGSKCIAKFEGIDTAEGVRKWFNGSEEDGKSLAQFVSIGGDIVLNKNQIVSIHRYIPKRKWWKF